MKEIKCPKCGEVITVDDSTFAAILEQVRTGEFSKEIDRRLAELKEQFKTKEEAVRSKSERDFGRQLSEKEREMSELRNEVTRLKGVIENFDATKKSALSELEAVKARELYDAVNKKDKRIIELESQVKADKLAAQNRENQLREQHKTQIQDKEAEIERLRDYRLRLSTKMVGENLEQHCMIKFEEAQSMGLFPDAVFMKDNLAVEGTKGDFIFRDFIDGNEYVSVMFEMKNEMDTTATKHRNDDFLEKLDKDRRRKECEYAVLVSMLEQDNELYNNGIVDKSHRYPKMIVIRPQFFLPVLRLISEGAKRGYNDRRALIKELETARNQSMDFAKFEDKLNHFRTTFNNNVTAAHKKFSAAYDSIDKIIEGLEKQIKALRDVKANFESSEQKLLKANELADENLTVKKLTYGNPNIRKMIEDAAKS